MEEAISEVIYKRRRIAVAAAILLYRKQNNKRRWWVHPANKCKQQQGEWDNLILEMRMTDEATFFEFTRLTLGQFDRLLAIVDPKLSKVHIFRKPIPSAARLALTLRHLATGDSLASLAFTFKIGKSTACIMIKETCKALWEVLSPIYLKFPAKEDWYKISKDFEHKWNLPNCVGALEGKHVVVQTPNNIGDEMNVVVFAICDANNKFTCIDVGKYEPNGDGGIFKESDFGIKLSKEDINLPKPSHLPNSKIRFPYYFVSNELFPLQKHILRPYGNNNADNEKRVFNFRISLARTCSENTFGLLVSRFKIFHRIINAQLDTVESIVKAAVCIHNYIQTEEDSSQMIPSKYCPQSYLDTYDNYGKKIIGDWRKNVPKGAGLNSVKTLTRRLGARNSTREVEQQRHILKQYLLSPVGEIPWQKKIV